MMHTSDCQTRTPRHSSQACVANCERRCTVLWMLPNVGENTMPGFGGGRILPRRGFSVTLLPQRLANIHSGFGGGDGGRQDASLTGWNASGKGYKGGVMPFMEFSDRDPIPKWDFQEPGARLRPCLRELNFWRHDTSTHVNKHGVKLHKALPLGTIGRSLADQFSEDQICSGQGFDLIIGAIRHHFRSYLEAEPEVQAETALYQIDEVSKRASCGIHVANQQQTS